MTDKWWETYDNIVMLTAWMAEHGWTAHDIAHAVEKPWKWTDEYRKAVEELREAVAP